jgi:hypothetical protein
MKTFLLDICLLISLFILSLSCNNFKEKSEAAAAKAKEKLNDAGQRIKEEKDKLLDRMNPDYNAKTPDTESNKRRFRENLKTEPTPDVKNIYGFADLAGADYKILMSFQCDSSTFRRILDANGFILIKDKTDGGLLFSEDFDWWDKTVIEKLPYAKQGIEGSYWRYIWYNEKKGMVYWQEFSL